MRARNQIQSEPGAFVSGSPGTVQPPTSVASKYPKGRSLPPTPRCGALYGHWNIFDCFVQSNQSPASSMQIFAPAFASTWAATPPPAPEPTITTSYVFGVAFTCAIEGSSLCVSPATEDAARKRAWQAKGLLHMLLRDVLIEVAFGHAEAELEIVAEVGSGVVVSSVERVFLLHAHAA